MTASEQKRIRGWVYNISAAHKMRSGDDKINPENFGLIVSKFLEYFEIAKQNGKIYRTPKRYILLYIAITDVLDNNLAKSIVFDNITPRNLLRLEKEIRNDLIAMKKNIEEYENDDGAFTVII